MGHALAVGWVAAIRRWPIALLLWAVGAGCGLAFSLISGRWLEVSLNASLASRTLLKDLDLNILGELFQRHNESFRFLIFAAVVLGTAHTLLSVWLNAGVIKSVQDPDTRFTLSDMWSEGFLLYRVFFRLWLLATTLEVVIVAATVLGVRAVQRWLVQSPNELSVYGAAAGGVVLATIGLIVVIAIHDQARIYVVRRRTGALRAYRWASWFVWHGDRRALALAVALLGIGCTLWVFYQAIADAIPVTSSTGVTMSLIWGQVLLLARAGMRLVAFGAQTDLQAELPE